MATVPEADIPTAQAEPLPGRAYPRFSDDASPQSFGSGIGSALETMGRKAQDRADTVRKADAMTQISAMTTALQYQGSDAMFSQKGVNAVDLPNRYGEAWDKGTEQILSTLPDRIRSDLAPHVASMKGQFNLEANRYEYEEGQRYATQVYKSFNQQTVTAGALNWRDPGAVEKARDQLTMSAAAEAVHNGFQADGPEAKQQHDNLIGQLHSTVVKQMVADGAIDKANDYLYAHIGEIPEPQSLSLQNMLVTSEAHQASADAKLLKAGSDKLSKDGDDLLRKGRMTAGWLEANKDKLEPNEYRYFTRELSGEGETLGNPETFADLLVRAYQGDDVMDQARYALTTGQMTRSNFDTIAGKVFGSRPGWAKRGAEYLNNALDPGQLNPDPAAKLSKANGLADWDEWVGRHPDATDAQAREAQEGIAHHYAIVAQDKTTLLMPAPKYLVGTRLAPDLAATSKATMDAYKSGELTLEEAQRQARIIAQYRSTLKAQADAAAEKKKQQAANP